MAIFFEDFQHDTAASILQRYPNSFRHIVGDDIGGWPLFKGATSASIDWGIFTIGSWTTPWWEESNKLSMYVEFDYNGNTTGADASVIWYAFGACQLARRTSTSMWLRDPYGNNGVILEFGAPTVELKSLYFKFDFNSMTYTVIADDTNIISFHSPLPAGYTINQTNPQFNRWIVHQTSTSRQMLEAPNFIKKIVIDTDEPSDKMLNIGNLNIVSRPITYVDSTNMNYQLNGYVEDVDKQLPTIEEPAVYATNVGEITYQLGAELPGELGSNVYMASRSDLSRALLINGETIPEWPFGAIPSDQTAVPIRAVSASENLKLEVTEVPAFKMVINTSTSVLTNNVYISLIDPDGVVIDWGDGTTLGPITQTGRYNAAGKAMPRPSTREVKIFGKCSELEIGSAYLREVLDWGNLNAKRIAFWNSTQSALTGVFPLTVPDYLPRSITSCANMFRNRAFNQPLPWDMSNVTTTQGMFYNTYNYNQPWLFTNTDNIVDLSYMFYMTEPQAIPFNQPLDLVLPSATNMSYFLTNTRPTYSRFNSPISIVAPNVTNFTNAFSGLMRMRGDITISCNRASFDRTFEGSDLTDATIIINGKVTRALNMFRGTKYNGLYLDDLDLSECTTIRYMLATNTVINRPITLNVPIATDAYGALHDCSVLNSPIIINSPSVTNVEYMFGHCTSLNSPVYVDMRNVTNGNNMFRGCSNFVQDISNWCVPKISSKPTNFDTGTSASWTTAMKPRWGTCPQGD